MLIGREGTPNRTAGRRLLAVMMMLVVVGLCMPQPSRSADDCLSAGGEAAVKACRIELREDPGNRNIRLALSDAYMSLRRYEEAVAVLREGFEHAPGDDAIKRQLSLAESYLEEKQWIEKQERQRAASKPGASTDTQTRLSVIRCNKLKGQAAISACNDGLKHAPDNPDLLSGRGSAWLALDQYGKAIADFQASLAAAPGNREATKKLRLAQTKREIKVSQCLQGAGQKALDACNATLLIGAADEFTIRIYTISGKIVKEIYKQDLGTLRIGNNITDYYWDGTDNYGDQLANGVYFYTVDISFFNEDFEQIETEADQYFTKGMGKMYLMR